MTTTSESSLPGVAMWRIHAFRIIYALAAAVIPWRHVWARYMAHPSEPWLKPKI